MLGYYCDQQNTIKSELKSTQSLKSVDGLSKPDDHVMHHWSRSFLAWYSLIPHNVTLEPGSP